MASIEASERRLGWGYGRHKCRDFLLSITQVTASAEGLTAFKDFVFDDETVALQLRQRKFGAEYKGEIKNAGSVPAGISRHIVSPGDPLTIRLRFRQVARQAVLPRWCRRRGEQTWLAGWSAGGDLQIA